MTRTLEVDYLVVGAGAMGMGFTDALVDHSDARVAIVDRRHSAGGHWLEDYPFVRLHQASSFYGVASTVLGGQVQQAGPEAGLHARASQPEIVDYYAHALERLRGTGRVEVFTGCEVVGRRVVSRISGQTWEVPSTCRVVNSHYLSPTIPAESSAPFSVADDAHAVAVNDLVRLEEAPSQYVVVGSGKTATDACVWLLQQGVDPDAICWVRPREPWMLNRALIQPDPTVFLGVPATTFEEAAASASLDELFLRLEDAGVMLRIDRSVTPTMAKAPTLGGWELDLLRSIGDVVRHGHVRHVERGRLEMADGTTVRVADDAVVVHCAADGLKNPPLVPVWRPEDITLQPVRAGFPCFAAAVTGYVEATRHDDAEKNRLCPPSRFGNSLVQWADMNVRGTRASMALGAEPDIAAWADTVAVNPARIPPAYAASEELGRVRERLAASTGPGLEALTRLMATG
ncbi:pyridine nucleotide-disulfide oxidoreductase [Nocardioides sp. zg-1230]|uniref:pyridine nucleotide-disulfide oxidoreductase n=1 Tax=Nocardioides sp. zg-1230 TaxID=2736601 RepID=UPI001553D2C3|nr:pyridine nucleotide-disulfide oxidoreductase [Nocardioides sp. zg-1230]NPC41349.1 pyridine nucleotide-disulfide oxidoreductase [Nocardioides sp. zg-1230]